MKEERIEAGQKEITEKAHWKNQHMVEMGKQKHFMKDDTKYVTQAFHAAQSLSKPR